MVLFIIGFSPIILHTMNNDFEIKIGDTFKMLGYICPPDIAKCKASEKLGPYGLGASLLSLVALAGIGLSIGLFFKLRSKNVYKIRQETKKLEDEFASALFQLGNRLGDGLPAEIAFAKVADGMQGTTSGNFFNLIEKNITKLGMGVQEAIFDPKVGALVYFPSKVIESSMKVMIESVKKGPQIAAQALLSMSRYIKEIHRVNERLKDLMADTISSMKSQVKFLTPAIAGIVIGPVFKLITSSATIELLSEIGIAFLLFIVGLEIDNILIQIDGGEIPILDGSSKEFINCLEKCGYKIYALAWEKKEYANSFYLGSEHELLSNNNNKISLIPISSEIRYLLYGRLNLFACHKDNLDFLKGQ